MKFHDAIIAGITHILQNRLRAALSILGILIGVASVLCMIAIGDGAKQIIAEDIDKLGGANQVQFLTRHGIWKGMRFIRRTTSVIRLMMHTRLKQNARMFCLFCQKTIGTAAPLPTDSEAKHICLWKA